MSGIQYMLMPISGAVIGYFTNWLAIKMLFRPHTEKRVMGVRIPFTPGLIPKERYHLAKKVGETVGKHLLTKEVLFDGITSLALEEKISEQLDRWVCDAMQREDTIENVLQRILPEKKEEIDGQLLEYLNQHVYQWATSPSFCATGAEQVGKYIIALLKEKKISEIAEAAYPYLEQYFLQFQETYFTEAQINSFCNAWIQKAYDKLIEKNLKLNEVIPSQWVETIEDQLLSLLAQSPAYLKEFFIKNPELDLQLKTMTKKIIEENIGKWASMFVNQDKVYENIKKGLFEYLENPENLVLIEVRAKVWAQNFMERECNPFFERIQQLEETGYKEKVISFVQENLKEYVFPYIQRKIQGQVMALPKDRTLYDLCNQYVENIDEKIFAFVSSKMGDVGLFLASEVEKGLPTYWGKLKTIQLKALLVRFEKQVAVLKKWTVFSAAKMVVVGSDYLSQNMNIEQIVEDKINQLDVTEAEEIIVSVVNKELQMITVLGGVLGFIIGFLPLLIR